VRRRTPRPRSSGLSGSTRSGSGATTRPSSWLRSCARATRGSNTAADHIEVLTDAIDQIPAAQRKQLLIRSDGAGASHQLLDWLTAQGRVRGRNLDYSVGLAITDKLRERRSRSSRTRSGPTRSTPTEASATGRHRRADRPAGPGDVAGRRASHCASRAAAPGAQLSLFEEVDGWRYQAFVTNTKPGQLAFFEARHRAHARVEDRIRHPRTPAWAGSRRGSSRSTRPG